MINILNRKTTICKVKANLLFTLNNKYSTVYRNKLIQSTKYI